MAQSYSKMAKIIRNLSYRYGLYSVFADFCELAACAYSNTFDKRHFDERESRYMNIVGKYTKEEVAEFPKLMGELAEEMEGNPRDVLGELFHELELHNEHAGQFFTPYSICEMMAKLTMDDAVVQKVNEKGHITLQEPACGAGAMVIGYAMAMRSKGLNYQQCLHVSAIDIDRRCVHMAYTQFTLLHIPAVVYLGDTLTMEMNEAWVTPAHVMGGWDWRLQIGRKTAAPQEAGHPKPPVVAEPTPAVVESLAASPSPAPSAPPSTPKVKSSTSRKTADSSQLSLFS